MTKTGLEFKILVIVICLIFDICDLEFLLLQYSSIPLVHQGGAPICQRTIRRLAVLARRMSK